MSAQRSRHDALERQARHAGRLDRVDHAIGLGDVHRHRLAEDDVLAGLRGPDGQLGELRDRRREVDDVDALALRAARRSRGSPSRRTCGVNAVQLRARCPRPRRRARPSDTPAALAPARTPNTSDPDQEWPRATDDRSRFSSTKRPLPKLQRPDQKTQHAEREHAEAEQDHPQRRSC